MTSCQLHANPFDTSAQTMIPTKTKRYSVYDYPTESKGLRVLLLGASGYLGQWLQVELSAGSPQLVLLCKSSKDLDFACEDEHTIFTQLDKALPLDVVVNCAAISTPGECAKNPSRARAVNVPTHLVKWLARQSDPPLLIHLSTDQVYEGTSSFYKESDDTVPVNEYGKTKLEAENLIRAMLPKNHVILRSSIILGPDAPIMPLNRSMFLQFIYSSLSSGKPTAFFMDEYRCPVSVFDVADVVRTCVERRDVFKMQGCTFNMGSPDRLSRAEMALMVSEFCGLHASLIEQVSATSVNRGVKSPADISMISSKLEAFMGKRMTSFQDTMRIVFT